MRAQKNYDQPMKISFSNRSVVKYCVTWSRDQRLFMIFVVDLNRDLNRFKSII